MPVPFFQCGNPCSNTAYQRVVSGVYSHTPKWRWQMRKWSALAGAALAVCLCVLPGDRSPAAGQGGKTAAGDPNIILDGKEFAQLKDSEVSKAIADLVFAHSLV